MLETIIGVIGIIVTSVSIVVTSISIRETKRNKDIKKATAQAKE